MKKIIISFITGFVLGFSLTILHFAYKKQEIKYVTDKKVIIDTIIRVDTITKNNPYVKIIVKYDTLKFGDTITLYKADTVFLFNMRKWTYKDNLLTFSFIANYVDTTSFQYSLNKSLLLPNNIFSFNLYSDKSYNLIYARRLFSNFYLNSSLQFNNFNYARDIKIGIGISFVW
ncbi:MAG: hypothetical protein QXI58_00190 [Candidatus Micrarchaeia archaeon]